MQISKDDAAAYLRNQGHETDVINGVVTIYVDEHTCIGLEGGKLLKRLKKALSGIGYDGSIGVKIKGGTE